MAKKPKKKGFFSRLFKTEPRNEMGLTTDEVVTLAAHLTRMKHDSAYRQQYLNQQMIDQIAENQQAIIKHTIEQGMTWLYPRFEDKLDNIINELKKK